MDCLCQQHSIQPEKFFGFRVPGYSSLLDNGIIYLTQRFKLLYDRFWSRLDLLLRAEDHVDYLEISGKTRSEAKNSVSYCVMRCFFQSAAAAEEKVTPARKREAWVPVFLCPSIVEN